MRLGKVPGSIVSVAVKGKPVYTHAFGYRDVEQKLPATADTIFGIGSITKSFTAVAIMQLQEQGKLSVTDPVLKYLPKFRFGRDGAEKAMTLHHLLTHSAGMPPLPTLLAAMARSLQRDAADMDEKDRKQILALKQIEDADQLLEYIAGLDVQPFGYPGQYFSYSNDGFALLGAIVAKVSGEPYEAYVMEHILKPLGMESSSFDSYKSTNVATLYATKRVKGREVVFASPAPWEAPSMAAAGFLRSTASDMLRYMDIYRTGGVGAGARILSAKSIDQMTTPYIRTDSGLYYGYGLMIHRNYRGVSLVEHGGNVKGVSTYVSCVRERGITGLALTNLQSSPGADLVLGAMNVLMGAPTTSRRFQFPKLEVAPERLKRYVGTYASGEATTIKVTFDGKSLIAETDGHRLPARPTGLDTFAVRQKGIDSAVEFLIGKDGEPWALCTHFRIVPRVK